MIKVFIAIFKEMGPWGKGITLGILLLPVLVVLNSFGLLDEFKSSEKGAHSSYEGCMNYYKGGAFKKSLEDRLATCMRIYGK